MKSPAIALRRCLEAASSFEDEPEWLTAVAASLAPVLDDGVGVQALQVRFREGTHELSEPVLVGGTSRWRGAWLENWWEPLVGSLDAETFRSMVTSGAVGSAQQLWASLPPALPVLAELLEELSAHGWAHAFRRAPPTEPPRLFYVDSLNVFVHDRSTASALCVVANRAALLSDEQLRVARRALRPLVPHLRLSLRARQRYQRARLLADAEAILTPEGTALHLVGPAREKAAREALRDAVRVRERARAACTDAEEAVRRWPGLTAGRWQVVDAYERDGRRYVVAVPNEPRPTLQGLSAREVEVVQALAAGRSNKALAEALGVSTATVGTIVHRAARKLGLRSRVELVRLAQAVIAAKAS